MLNIVKLIISVLNHLPTHELILQITPICHRFRNIVQRIIDARMVRFLPPEHLHITLRCSQPFESPAVFQFGNYLGTPGLSDILENDSSSPRPNPESTAGNAGFGSLYSRFEPTGKDGERCQVSTGIQIDGSEPFSQLIMSLWFMKKLTCKKWAQWFVQRKKNIRLMKDWLVQSAFSIKAPGNSHFRGSGYEKQASIFDGLEPMRTIWTDESRNIGLKVWVEDLTVSIPIGRCRGEDDSLRFKIHLEGMYKLPFQLLSSEQQNSHGSVINFFGISSYMRTKN